MIIIIIITVRRSVPCHCAQATAHYSSASGGVDAVDSCLRQNRVLLLHCFFSGRASGACCVACQLLAWWHGSICIPLLNAIFRCSLAFFGRGHTYSLLNASFVSAHLGLPWRPLSDSCNLLHCQASILRCVMYMLQSCDRQLLLLLSGTLHVCDSAIYCSAIEKCYARWAGSTFFVLFLRQAPTLLCVCSLGAAVGLDLACFVGHKQRLPCMVQARRQLALHCLTVIWGGCYIEGSSKSVLMLG
jgi:hypothetical protein